MTEEEKKAYHQKQDKLKKEALSNMDNYSVVVNDHTMVTYPKTRLIVNKFARENGVECNYKPFAFIAKENEKMIGLITGHSYYKEVYISDLVVLEEYIVSSALPCCLYS